MFSDDITVFFADGVECKIGSATAKAYLDKPEANLGLGDEGVRASAYVITAPVVSFPDAKVGDAVVAEGKTFKVRSLLKIDDGQIWSIDVL